VIQRYRTMLEYLDRQIAKRDLEIERNFDIIQSLVSRLQNKPSQ
jgi:hypothetical protein